MESKCRDLFFALVPRHRLEWASRTQSVLITDSRTREKSHVKQAMRCPRSSTINKDRKINLHWGIIFHKMSVEFDFKLFQTKLMTLVSKLQSVFFGLFSVSKTYINVTAIFLAIQTAVLKLVCLTQSDTVEKFNSGEILLRCAILATKY